MNTYTSRTTFVVSLLIILCVFTTKFAEAQLQGDQLKNAIESRNFAFTVTHESGGDFALGNYYLHLINDSLSTVLPYSGRSNTAAYTIDENGINMRTKSFTYQETPTKKGGYNIKILLNNDRTANSFTLRVKKNGVAMLTADCINRDSEVYTGVIQVL